MGALVRALAYSRSLLTWERTLRNGTSNVQVELLESTARAEDKDNKLQVGVAHVQAMHWIQHAKSCQEVGH